MKTKEYDTLLHEALTLAARYFDGVTSLADEKRLRSLLADPSLSSEELDEARAVIGFALFDKEVPPVSRHDNSWLRVSAGVAAVVAAAVAFMFGPADNVACSDTGSHCVAFVGGRKVTDRNVVLAMVDQDLSEFSDAFMEISRQIDGQLSEFSSLAGEKEL